VLSERQEQRLGFVRRQTRQISFGLAYELPTTASTGLGVDRHAAHCQGFEVTTCCAHRDLKLVGNLGGDYLAARLHDHQGRYQSVSTHG